MTERIIKSVNFSTFLNTKKQDVVFNLNRVILNTNAYAVSQFSTTNSFLNIDSRNNILKFTEKIASVETTFTVTITPTDYTIAALITEVKTKMDAAGALIYTVSHDTLIDVLTITASASEFHLEDVADDIYYELGYGGTLDKTFSIAKVAPNSFDLSGVKVIYVQTSDFGSGRNINVNSLKNLICSIQVDVPYMGVISYNPPLNFINTKIASLGTCEFSLYDEHFRKLNVRSNWNLSMSLSQD